MLLRMYVSQGAAVGALAYLSDLKANYGLEEASAIV